MTKNEKLMDLVKLAVKNGWEHKYKDVILNPKTELVIIDNSVYLRNYKEDCWFQELTLTTCLTTLILEMIC